MIELSHATTVQINAYFDASEKADTHKGRAVFEFIRDYDKTGKEDRPALKSLFAELMGLDNSVNPKTGKAKDPVGPLMSVVRWYCKNRHEGNWDDLRTALYHGGLTFAAMDAAYRDKPKKATEDKETTALDLLLRAVSFAKSATDKVMTADEVAAVLEKCRELDALIGTLEGMAYDANEAVSGVVKAERVKVSA